MAGEAEEFQRGTAKRKAAVVLEVLNKQITSVEACRKYGIKQSELEAWTARFLESGENGLRSNPRQERELYEARLKELHAKIGGLTLSRDVLTKSLELKEQGEKRF